jgi:hypothetical protein
VVTISKDTAEATGLLSEALNYEQVRSIERGVEETKRVSADLLLTYLDGWRAEYPGQAFDLQGSEDEGGKLLRLSIKQSAPRTTLDPTLLSLRLLELGVSVEVIDQAMDAATKVGESGKPYVDVRRVKGVG